MGFSAAKILPCPPYTPLGTIEIREGFGPLELSKDFSTVCVIAFVAITEKGRPISPTESRKKSIFGKTH